MSEQEPSPSQPHPQESSETPRHLGQITEWNSARGFGFVEHQGQRLFVHINNLPQGLIATANGGTDLKGIELEIISTDSRENQGRQSIRIQKCREVTPESLNKVEVSELDKEGYPYYYFVRWNSKTLKNRPDNLLQEVQRRSNLYKAAPSGSAEQQELFARSYEVLTYRIHEANRTVVTGYQRNREGVVAFMRGLGMQPWHDPETNTLYAFADEPPTNINKLYGESVLKKAAEHGGFARVQIVQTAPAEAYAVVARGFGTPTLELQAKPISVDQHNIVRQEQPLISGGKPIYWEEPNYASLDISAFPEQVHDPLKRLIILLKQQEELFQAQYSPDSDHRALADSMPNPSPFEIAGLKAKVALILHSLDGIGRVAYGPGNPSGVDTQHTIFTDASISEIVEQTRIAAQLATDNPISQIRIDRRAVILPSGQQILADIGVIRYQDGTEQLRVV